jgi:predicted alpha/beta hydrolase family esterase
VARRAFLLLHGFFHHRPPGHWQYWLANRLRRRGERVLYPGLPFEDEPRYAEWREALHWLLMQLDQDEERVVVCNSLSCLLWFRFATDRQIDEPIADRLLLVVPPDSAAIPAAASGLGIDGLDGPAVQATSAHRIRLVASDNDPFNPRGADAYARALEAEVDLIPGAGHIGPIEGYGPWPSLEAWCLDPAVHVEPNFPADGLGA